MNNRAEYYQKPLEQMLPVPSNPVCGLLDDGVCVTCSDEALPARVLNIEPATGLARVEVMGTTTEVDVTLVEAVVPGDWLLVHGGVAIARMEQQGND